MIYFFIFSIFFWIPLAAAKSGSGEEEGPLYSPVGKRDPFRPPLSTKMDRSPASIQGSSALEQYSIQQLQLRAIMKGIGKPKVLFEDPSGGTHILQEGESVGRERGVLSRVLDNEVIVTERTKNYRGVESLYERVISLPKQNE